MTEASRRYLGHHNWTNAVKFPLQRLSSPQVFISSTSMWKILFYGKLNTFKLSTTNL